MDLQSESPLSRILVELSVFYGNVARFGYLSLATATFKAFPIGGENKLVPKRALIDSILVRKHTACEDGTTRLQ